MYDYNELIYFLFEWLFAFDEFSTMYGSNVNLLSSHFSSKLQNVLATVALALIHTVLNYHVIQKRDLYRCGVTLPQFSGKTSLIMLFYTHHCTRTNRELTLIILNWMFSFFFWLVYSPISVYTHPGPSAGYPDAMSYMMDGQAQMMHRPPGDPTFHQGYHYPPAEYYPHHL